MSLRALLWFVVAVTIGEIMIFGVEAGSAGVAVLGGAALATLGRREEE